MLPQIEFACAGNSEVLFATAKHEILGHHMRRKIAQIKDVNKKAAEDITTIYILLLRGHLYIKEREREDRANNRERSENTEEGEKLLGDRRKKLDERVLPFLVEEEKKKRFSAPDPLPNR